MLTREEENLIKCYSVLNTIGIEARLLVRLILVVGIMLDVIGVLWYNHEATWIIETMIFIGLFMMYGVIVLCGVYVPYYGMRRPMWSTLVEKALEEYKRKILSDEMATEIGLSRMGDMMLAVGRNKEDAVMREAGYLVKKLERWDYLLHGPFEPTIRAAEVRHDINFVARTCGVKLPETIGLVFLTAAVPMLILATMFIYNYII